MKDFLTKSKSFTNPEYGCAPEEREISDYISHGVINLDKPSGPTSHEIDSWVKSILNLEKSGHGGTLDPKVTGVLPVGLGDATRAIQLLLTAPKESSVQGSAEKQQSDPVPSKLPEPEKKQEEHLILKPILEEEKRPKRKGLFSRVVSAVFDE